ncbi:DMT family transporter [Roseivivax isoporae]|uniref:Membrane protein n=1 Tax=Roseivivax isoporae LMG 25204 TaxID=1449351 RepID=X7F8N1_9RHOB|nr:DMT family transporter [Roseivivax isoporae]ETX28444.1 membrane protein [Roseivivax isoporae LMG 25204]
MFVAMSCIPAGDTAGKILLTDHGLPPVFVAWARFCVGALAVLPFVPAGTLRLLRDWRIWGRAVLMASGIVSIQAALATAPIASVFAAFFIGPIVSYALSALVLREPVTRLRTALMAVGFAGVLLVVRPGFDAAPGLWFAVLAGLFYGSFLTASRAVTGLGSPLALLFTQLLCGAALLAPAALPRVPPVDAGMAGLLLASGLFSMAGNLLLLMAYRIGTASAIAPLVYFQLVAATVLGWVVFGDLPDALTWAGLALILGAGIASARAGRAAFGVARR